MKHTAAEPLRTPEQELLLGAIRVDRAWDGRLRDLLTQGLDWPALRQTALRQKVLPLLYTRLKALGEDVLPPEEMARLQELYLANARATLMLSRRLLSVLNLLSGQGIEALPLKGPALAIQAYGDVALRQFPADLDILIHVEDLNRVYDLLIQAGYRALVPLKPKTAPWLPVAEKDLPFLGGGGMLEIHWAASPSYLASRISQERFWQQRTPLRLNGKEIRGLSPGDTCLLLCLHGAAHQWQRLGLIADLAHLARAYPNLDWLALLDWAERFHLRTILCLGLQLAERIGGAEFAPDVRARFHADSSARALAARVMRRPFDGDETTLPPMTKFSFGLRSKEHFPDRLYYVFHRFLALTRDDLIATDLPDSLFPLYYLLRPWRLLRKYGRMLVTQWILGRRNPAPRAR